MTRPINIHDRWQTDEDLMAETPRELTALPQWMRDRPAGTAPTDDKKVPDAETTPTVR